MLDEGLHDLSAVRVLPLAKLDEDVSQSKHGGKVMTSYSTQRAI